jgi:tRNA 2-thiouridine synthesizing protein B
MILHTINSSPLSHLALQNCLNHIGTNDYVLLIGDAVIAACANVEQRDRLLSLHDNQCLFVLQADLQARGLSAEIGQLIDYAGFVNLAVECKSQLAW